MFVSHPVRIRGVGEICTYNGTSDTEAYRPFHLISDGTGDGCVMLRSIRYHWKDDEADELFRNIVILRDLLNWSDHWYVISNSSLAASGE